MKLGFFDEGTFTLRLKMDFESSKAGTNIEILYDNLMVRSGKRQNG